MKPITKQAFLDAMKALQAQIAHDDAATEHLSKALNLNSHFVGYDNNHVVGGMLDLLADLTCDTNEDIRYFAWELDFGKKWRKGCVKSADGKDIPLRNAEELWDLLESYKKGEDKKL